MPDLEKDQVLLSRFSLLEMIGEGGMGQVWLVWDQELEIEIAIKILNPQLTTDPDRINLLKNECRNTRRLTHPNIVRVFDFHRSDDLAFISMEYVNGRDLRYYRSEFDPASTGNLIKLIRPVINALGYAHELGLVHRDFKAANILVDRQRVPRLTDFGIAAVFKSSHRAMEMTSGGSLFCMSPQQLDDQPPHPSDDIYALGVLLYEMYCGQPPFYPDITRQKILHENPISLNQRLNQLAIDVHVPEPLEDLIDGMLAKEPADRPANMEDIDMQLERLLRPESVTDQVPHETQTGTLGDDSTFARPEIITPVKVAPGVSGSGSPLARRSNLVKGVALAIALVVLVAGGLWLWHYLPLQMTEQRQTQIPVRSELQVESEKIIETPEVLPETETDSTELAAEKNKAEKKLGEFLQIIQELDATGAPQWGEAQFSEIIQISESADRLLLERNYAAAAAKYEEAIARARALVGQLEPVFKQLLAEGQTALDQGNSEIAQQKFSIALMMQPDNRLAQHNLQRAKNLDAVMQLMESGKGYEEAGKIALAQSDYQEALRLDPELKEARQALTRVKGQIRDTEFQLLMSEGLTALHNNDYQAARAKLLKAKSLKPQSREVKDALAQVDQAIRLTRIETYRQKAAAAEQAEDWDQALDAYLQVLKIDPNVQFAARGQIRAQERIRIERRINFFIQKPSALESDHQLNNAIGLIAEIEEIDPKGPHLKDRYEQLARMVADAQTTVEIIIESDTFTDIAVYRIGKLGRFENRQLNLRPGTYTVVGTRNGYQDVRREIVIKPGQRSMRVTIKCEVKL